MASSPAEALPLADGPRAVVEALAGLSEPDRRALAPALLAEVRRYNPAFFFAPPALLLALVGTASLSELKRWGVRDFVVKRLEFALDVLVDRRPEWLGTWIAWLVERDPHQYLFMLDLVAAGVVEHRYDDAEVLGIVALPFVLRLRDRERVHDFAEELREVLVSDRHLLERGLWRLFEVEGGGEVSLANADKYGGRGIWSETLVAMSAAGELPRERLLDASLAALARDFSSYRAGWFSRFHEALDPTLDERAQRTAGYGRLLSSTVANTVSFALKALTRIARAGRLELDDELAARLAPALASDRRGIAAAALKLLPDGEAGALAAGAALAHRDAAVQAAALDVAERSLTPAVRERLRAAASDIAPTLRARLAAAAGEDARVAAAAEPRVAAAGDEGARIAALPVRMREPAGVDAALAAAARGALPGRLDFRVADLPVLGLYAPVAPLDDVDEVIEVLARWVEDEIAVGAELERAFAALALMGAEQPADFGQRTASLRKRAAGLEPHRPKRKLVEAWLDGVAPGPPYDDDRYVLGPRPADGRILELARQLAARRAAPLLATPTHAGGWLDPRTFLERLAAQPEPGPHDLVAALCRLAPERRDPAAAPDGPCADIVRYALGGALPAEADPALLRAAQLARETDRTDPEITISSDVRWEFIVATATSSLDDLRGVPALRVGAPAARLSYGRERDRLQLGLADAARVEEAALLAPAGHVRLWVEALRAFEGGEQQRAGRLRSHEGAAKLVLALDPDRPLGDMGALTVVFGLVAEDAEPRAAALDAAIAAVADGRLDGDALGTWARTLLERELLVPGRLAAALRTVAADSPLHAEVARAVLEHAVAAAPARPQPLLDALNELAADAGAAVELPAARAALAAHTGKGKAATLARGLLERDGVSRHGPAARAQAVAARIERAERWAAAEGQDGTRPA